MEITNIYSPFRYLLLFIVLVLAQVLICNNILLFGVAVPFVFIYFILSLPLNMSLNLVLVLSFALGFFIDIFSDTLGLNSLACIILAVLRRPMFYAYMPREDKMVNLIPCIASMGWENYLKYAVTLSTLFCLVVFGIEFFSFESFGRIIVMALSSMVFTAVLLITADSLFRPNTARDDR